MAGRVGEQDGRERGRPRRRRVSVATVSFLVAAAFVVLRLDASPAHAYIGPGAGFALAGSLLAVFSAFVSALTLLLVWPARMAWRALFWWRWAARGRFKRVAILGLDGLDYTLPEQMLADGQLPHQRS